MLSSTKECEHFHTKSGAHFAGAHTDRIVIQTDFRNSHQGGMNYTKAEMWMMPGEARELLRVLALAIAETEAYQASQVAPQADRAE
jgi:hypothetical protein